MSNDRARAGSPSTDGAVGGGRSADAISEWLDREHRSAMLAYATGLTGDRLGAEDVVQEALMRAWLRPETMTNGQGSVRGWLLTTVRHLVIDQHRARRSRPPEVLAEFAEDGLAASLARGDHADATVARMVVDQAMEQITDGHRTVLAHLYLGERTVSETSVALSVPEGTVKSRSYYALRRLRALLEEGEARVA